MIVWLAFFGIVAFLATIVSRSRNVTNSITVLHALSILVLSFVTYANQTLPIYVLRNHYFFLDALGIYEIMISSVVFLLASIYARGYVESLIKSDELSPRNITLFYACFNLLLTTVVLAFCANNLALMWLCIELTTLLSAILIVILNAKENIAAAIKYLFIVSSCMVFSFAGIILLFGMSKLALGEGSLEWDVLMQHASSFSPNLFVFVFLLTFIGFAAKSGIAPFHAWLPVTYAKAPSDVSALLSSSVANLGIYGIIRMYSIGVKTEAAHFITNLLLVFGILTVAIAAFSMIKRYNLKKLIAFSSIENGGILLLGLCAGNVFWVLYHTLAHALTKTLLFFSAGIFRRQYGSSRIEFMHSFFSLQPLASVGLIAGKVAIVGMPLFPLAISKLFILAGLMKVSWVAVFIVLVCLLIIATSFTLFMMRLLQNESKPIEKFVVPLSMQIPIIILLIAIVALGIYIPSGFIELLNEIVTGLK